MRSLIRIFAALALVSGCVCTVSVAAAAAPEVAIYPSTDTAHPDSDVSVRGVAAGDIEVVGVSGSRSGSLASSLRPHRDGRGATIVLRHRLAADEDVVVDLKVAGRSVQHSFSTGQPGPHPGVQLDEPSAPAGAAAAAAAAAPPDYVTRPDLRPPGITVNRPTTVDRAGLLLTTPVGTADSAEGVLVFDDDGEVVWFRPNTNSATNVGDLKALDLGGRRVLAWFEGVTPLGPSHHRGEWIVVDEAYREIARIRAGNGMQADIHDLQLTADGTALLVVYHPVVRDLSSVGGQRDALVLEAVVQEVDVSTRDVLFEWHSLDHIPLSDSYASLTGPQVDYVHINAVEEDVDGNLLLSLRHASQIVKINRRTGAVMWRLGGKRSSFTFGSDEGISYPHDVRSTGTGVSIFDNGNQKNPQFSRGVVYDLDPASGTATLVREFRNRPNDSFAATRGSMRLLEDGSASIGWGGLGVVTEMRATGDETFEATLSAGTYRIVRQEWTGRPTAPPAVAVTTSGGTRRVHASWNGATEVASWQVLAGTDPARLSAVTTAARTGFETAIPVTGSPRFVAVRALDDDGRALGRSAAIPTGAWYQERATRTANGVHRPVVGDFVDGPQDDVFWHGPNVPESLWPANGTQFGATLPTPQTRGDYRTIVGDFFGDRYDEIVFWRPRSTTAYIWSWNDGAVTDHRISIPAVDMAVLLDHTAGPDEIVWFGVGAAPDRIDGFRRSGSGVRRVSRAFSSSGSYTAVSGDFDANGWADVVWYRPGTAADYIWFTSGQSGAPSGHRSQTFHTNGTYRPVVARLDGSEDATDDILWVGASDWLWAGRTNGSFASSRVSVPSGQPIAVPGRRDHVFLWQPGGQSSIVRRAPGAPFSFASRNTAMPASALPLVGDFVEAGQASIFWYRSGAGAERLFVSPVG